MLNFDLRPFSQFALAAATTDEPSMGAVVLTGISLVFGILVLLWLVLTLEGKIFSSIDEKKKAKANIPAPQQKAAPAPAAPAVAPVVEEGISPEVVAAIAAAVASIEGGKYTLRSVQVSQKGRGQWGLAGIVSNTEPF